jgi:hypothetical protein
MIGNHFDRMKITERIDIGIKHSVFDNLGTRPIGHVHFDRTARDGVDMARTDMQTAGKVGGVIVQIVFGEIILRLVGVPVKMQSEVMKVNDIL